MTLFDWAVLRAETGFKVRRASWPKGWRVWGTQYGLICGFGNQIGADNSLRIEGVGRDGCRWTPTEDDKAATDWELL